jgi:type VI secretion system secreted protein Hcp
MAAVDYFIKFDGIKGESADSKHKDEIDIESWSWGAIQQGSIGHGGGGGAGKVDLQDFHFVMKLNTASTALLKACTTGQHIKTATLTARKAGKGQADYLIFKFYDVLVSSYQIGGSEQASPVPTDSCSFNFAKFEMEYKRQRPDGTYVQGGTFKYDLKSNKTF